MYIRSLALATATVALLASGIASAAPTTVQLRVEGSTATLFEGPVTTDGHMIDKGDGPHPCDGTNGNANPAPGPTMTSALDDWSRTGGLPWAGTWFSGFDDFVIDAIGPDAAQTATGAFWGYALNFTPSQIGGCQQEVNAGDQVLFAYDFFNKAHLLRLDGPGRAVTGQPFQITVTDGQSGAPIDGASVTGGSAPTDVAGHAEVTLGTGGLAFLKAERADSVRSNRVSVCASASGTEDCGVPPEQLGGSPSSKPVRDSVAPRVRIRGPKDGAHYRHGPRLLSGTATDDVGVTKVKLALRRHEHGKACRWWSATSDRFAGRGCAKKVFFGIGTGTGSGSWSFLLPRRLPPGRYVLDAKAFDRARNRDERFVRGSNRVVFYVSRRRRTRAAAAARTAARVDVLLAGRSTSARASVRARATLVKVGHRRCRVGSSTPLAALTGLLRARHTTYAIRDYGSCSRTNPAAASQLFVRRIGRDSNRGNDGWFYKLNDRAPEVGAGDPSARVRDGDRVLWFYCVFDATTRSCQRSLRIVPAAAASNGALRLTVRGYDNAGRSAPVAGATVASGSVTATTGSDGSATLMLGGAPGRHAITARKAGMVDAFPVTVRVK